MSNFLEVVKERRSANKFIEGIKIPKEDFIEIFTDLTLPVLIKCGPAHKSVNSPCL